MNKKKPDITVVMSVNKNINNFLNQSIDSVLNQTFTNFEFIIINDGKDKEVEKIILDYNKKDTRIIYKFTKGIGLTASLNYGISFSNSNYIARQDYDDISNINRLEKQLNFLNQNQDYIFCASRYEKIDENNNILSNNLSIFNKKNFNKILIYKNPFVHSSCMFLKSSFIASGKYNEKFLFSQDYELWTRLIKVGNFKLLNEKLVKLRIHSKSISSLKNKYQRFYSLIIGLKFLYPVLEKDLEKLNHELYLYNLEKKYKNNKDLFNQIIARKYVYLYDEVKTLKFFFLSYKVIFSIIKIYLNRPSYILHRLLKSF